MKTSKTHTSRAPSSAASAFALLAISALFALPNVASAAALGGANPAKNGATMPPAAAQILQVQMPLTVKPRLTGINLVKSEFPPGAVELMVNMQSTAPSESCQFNVNILTNNAGNDTINSQVAGPLTYHFTLPATAQKIPLGVMPVGKYRLSMGAVTLANPACVGGASADFEVKRFKINIPADITGVKLSDDGYDKTNKMWMVGIEGHSTTPCGYIVRLKHEASGKTIENTGISTLPLSQSIGFDQQPPYGQYQVTVGPWTPVPVSDVPACMGTKSASARLAAPSMGPLNLMTIDYSTVSITTPLGNNSFTEDSTLGNLFMPTAISMNVHTINQPANGQNCAYTLTVAKDGAQKQVAYSTGQPVDVLAAIKQGPGWGKGQYTISVHASPLNTGSGLPSCLGKRTHKLTVVDGGAIASGIDSLTHSKTCETAWDSNSALAAYEKKFCVVTIKPKITGAACNYTIQVQEPGKSPTYYNKIHYVEGADFLSFEYYRGKYDQTMANTLSAMHYVVRVFASAQDKAGGAACTGEYYNASVPLFTN